MSTAAVTFAVVIGIAIMFALFYVSSNIEKGRAARALEISSLRSRINLLSDILDGTPPAFMPHGLKIVILKEIHKRYVKLAGLEPNKAAYTNNINILATTIESESSTTNKTPVLKPFKTLEESQKTRTQMQDLTKLVESFAKSGTISVGTAKNYLSEMKGNFFKAQGGFIYTQADIAYQEGKLQNAILLFKKASKVFERHNVANVHDDTLAEIKARIAEADLQLKEEQASSAVESSELNKGMEGISSDDDSWKKKYF